MVKQFENLNSYYAEGSAQESRVSKVIGNGRVYYDGVNIITDNPVLGDAVYKKNGEIIYFKREGLDHSKLISEGFYDLGQVNGQQDDSVVYLDKEIKSSIKYLDVCQYAITAISSTTLSIKLRMSPDYAVDTTIDVELDDTSISVDNATIINDAVEAKATEVGDTKDWWAYLDAENNRIIIQCDTCVDYRFYNVSATGCTIALCVWEDMPSNNGYFKSNGRYTNYRGLLNIARGSSYWQTNGRAEAGANDVWHGAIGANDNPLQRSVFLTSEMAGSGNHQYQTYESYLRGEFGILYNQKYGCFTLPDPKTLTLKYGNKSVPTKNGGTKFKFPALHYPLTIDRGVDGLRAGDIFLNGLKEGAIFMRDENMAIINDTRRKMSHTLISNGSYRWFAERYSVNGAWDFGGYNGTLYSSYVTNEIQGQGMALLPFNH